MILHHPKSHLKENRCQIYQLTANEVKVAIEMPGVPKEKIKIQAYEDKVESRE